MDLRKLDAALLGAVFVLQTALLFRLRHRSHLPVFLGYLAFALISFIPWILNLGPSDSLLMQVFIAILKVCVATEAVYLAKGNLLPYFVAFAALIALVIAAPAAYPDFPMAAYYVRTAGHLIGLTIAAGGFAYAVSTRHAGFAVKHLGILAIYFGSMLFAAATPSTWWTAAHCALMAVHAGCMTAWLSITRRGTVFVS